MTDHLKDSIRSIPDFPKPGIVFRDITTLLKNPDTFASAVEVLFDAYKDERIDKVVGIESRGFILGAALALKLNAGFVPIRKQGKLPGKVISQDYELEYGTDSIEIHADAIDKGERILLHDDLLATGGTIDASCRLVERLGGIVIGISFLVELSFLHGRERISRYPVHSLILYDEE